MLSLNQGINLKQLLNLVEFPCIHGCKCKRLFDSRGVPNCRSRAQNVKIASVSFISTGNVFNAG